MIEWIDEARTHAKQSLLREPWSLPFDREILGVWQNLEPKFYVPQGLDTVCPAHWPHLTSVRPLSPVAGHTSQEQKANTEAARTRAATTESDQKRDWARRTTELGGVLSGVNIYYWLLMQNIPHNFFQLELTQHLHSLRVSWW